MYYTYIVECTDSTYYTGYTTKLKRRVEVHNKGKGAKYTRARRPVKLVYWEEYDTKEEAMKREWKIKKMSRREKEKLIKKINGDSF